MLSPLLWLASLLLVHPFPPSVAGASRQVKDLLQMAHCSISSMLETLTPDSMNLHACGPWYHFILFIYIVVLRVVFRARQTKNLGDLP